MRSNRSFDTLTNYTYITNQQYTSMSLWVPFIGLLIAIALSFGIWFAAPKQDQTVWRSTGILTVAMIFLMWAITYLAQLNPLVVPRRSDLRPEF
ncbi:hypothetical protein WICPIJ_003346 [Wickerhamomyces pijperi]|uniref:V-type proton ATPase subunit n=1 Tax=Wickerhamomyces pijperi TaxID=599730 RepID=A0A9P8Q9T0_WICPI|nr:hypothetical protein WICPIJ_003346 [Wickerhamomyces pijperi]